MGWKDYRPPKIAVIGFLLLLLALAGGALSRGYLPTAVNAAPGSDLPLQTAGRLTYGTSVVGSVNPASPVSIYSFTGALGDLVNVQVVGMTPNMTPSIVLLSDTQERLVNNNNDVFSPITGDASLSWFLPYSGLYLLVVTDAQAQAVDFVMRLDGRAEVISPLLQPNVPVRVDIPADSEVQFFRFQHQSQCFSTLTIIPDVPDFPFTAHVRTEFGPSVAVLRGGALREDRVTIPPNSGVYEIEVGPATREAEGYVILVLTCAEDAPFCAGAADLGSVDLVLPGGRIGAPAEIVVPPPPTTPPQQPVVTAPPPQTPPTDTPTPPPAEPDCGAFRLSSPTDGLPNGPVAVFWDPAPVVTGYQVTAINLDNGRSTGASTGPETTSATLDVGTAALGDGFTFLIRVVALNGDSGICADERTLLREVPPPPLDDPGDVPTCNNDGQCNREAGENCETCFSDCVNAMQCATRPMCNNNDICEPGENDSCDDCGFLG